MANPNNHCDQCKATGLPILLVRYTVVPKAVTPALPTWAGGDRVKSVDVGEDFHYALRTLRTGYVYLFYEKNARGRKQWECYSVGQDGSVIRQPDPQSAQPQSTPVLQCTRHGVNNTQVHYLVIDKPEKCGPTWIAFSEHKWSDETLKDYENNRKGIRNKRMQTLHPSKMMEGAKHSHGALADAAALEAVLEYAEQNPAIHLPYDAAVSPISQVNGYADIGSLQRISTRYPWHLRKGMAASTVEHMKKRGKSKGAPDSPPHILALWDAVGITHELNGYRNEAAGWVKKYGDERDLQLRAVNLYDGLKGAVQDYSLGRADQKAGEHVDRRARDASKRQSDAVEGYFKDPGATNRALYYLDRERDSGLISEDEYRRQRDVLIDQGAYPNRRDAARAIFKELDDERAGRDEFRKRYRDVYYIDDWPGYEKRIQPARKTFVDNSNHFEEQAQKIVAKRTEPLLKWLEAPLLIDTFNDFHGENVEDGLLFEDCVAEALWGIGSCKAGKTKLEEWVKEAKATIDTNLMWRVMALNQDKVREELDAVLSKAKEDKDAQTLASVLVGTGYLAKSAKAFADTYKKAQTVFNANTNASSEAGTVAFGARLKPVNMRGVDKFAISVGDSVFRYFRIDQLADFACEKIIQHLFSVRGMVDPADSINLIIAQAKEEGLTRTQTLKRIRSARTFLAADTPEMKTAQAENLKAAWGNFKSSDAVRAPQAIKEARLALVVGLIEGVNFAKLMADCKAKGDAKSYFMLLASGMAIASATLEIASVPAKFLPQMGVQSWQYQSLKMWGGALSGGATWIGAWFDKEDAQKNKEKGYQWVSYLYMGKAAAGLVAGVFTFATTFTYAAPLIGRLAGNAAVGTAVRAVGARAAAFIGLRILGLAVGGWVTVILFGLQVIIWQVTPDALEEWIDHSAFGKNNDPKKGGYKTGDEQDKKLTEALKEMGFPA